MTAIQVVRDTGTRYDDDVKRRAFQVYAYRAGRRIQETSRLLKAMGDDIEASTLYEWRQTLEWDHQLALKEAMKQEELVREFAGKLRTVAPDAVVYLDNVAQGRVEGDPLRVRAAQILATENRHLVVALEKERERERQRNPQLTILDHSLETLSPAELLALETPYHPGS